MSSRIDLPPFPDGWYRVASSADVAAGTVIPLHFFGRDLIAFRGESGSAHVLDAYCAHLGAHIGRGGFVDGEEVVCPFHNWHYDGGGQNVGIPYSDKPHRGAKLTCWPMVEVNGHLVVWNSPAGRTPDWEPPAIPEAVDPAFIRVEGGESWTIQSHVQEIFENTVDIAHFRFVHGVSGFGAVELVEEGPMFRSIASVTMQTSRGEVDGAIESELWGLGMDLVRQRGIGDARTIFTITPVEEDVVHASYTFFVPRDGDGPSKYGRAFMREFSRQINQDIPIWENKIYRATPRLAMGEGAIVDFRRWAHQFYDQPAPVAA
jgi:phenylpropionate dioxygenase-like ring-hydroxylating dioxygenase large terminal subunit